MTERDEEEGASGLEAVLLANKAPLLRFLRARGAGPDAEDILQEIWIRLGAAGASGPIANPVAYLHRMADNLMHDRRRSAERRARREFAWSDATGATVPGVSDEPSIERVVIAREGVRAVERALAQLSERSRTIFRRFRFDGVDQRSVAAEQGISVSAVEKHLQRAYLAIMKEQQQPDEGEGRRRRPLGEGTSDAAE